MRPSSTGSRRCTHAPRGRISLNTASTPPPGTPPPGTPPPGTPPPGTPPPGSSSGSRTTQSPVTGARRS
ncbi:MAG: hypothetical protein D6683_15075 [Actinomyces sp.]|nr:MAG: hypothetical protein D6683_15075 [Actinomyces sp.]